MQVICCGLNSRQTGRSYARSCCKPSVCDLGGCVMFHQSCLLAGLPDPLLLLSLQTSLTGQLVVYQQKSTSMFCRNATDLQSLLAIKVACQSS